MLINTKNQTNCPACEESGSRLYNNASDYYFNSPDSWSISRCPKCETLWLDPAPLPEEIGKAYANYHTHTADKNNKYASIALRIFKKLFHVKFLLHPDYRSLVAEQKNARFLNLKHQKREKLLDIGCGGGRFLHRMQRIGWDVEGVDFDAAATRKVEEKYGFRVYTGDLRDIKLQANSYDVVVMSHAIEHVCDPASLMGEVRRILKKGGRLIIVTPNSNAVARRRFGIYWRGLEVPRHIQIFSPTGLSLLIKNSGLKLLEAYTFAHGSEGIYYVSKQMKNSKSNKYFDQIKELYKSKIATLAEHRRLKLNGNIGEDIYISAIKLNS